MHVGVVEHDVAPVPDSAGRVGTLRVAMTWASIQQVEGQCQSEAQVGICSWTVMDGIVYNAAVAGVRIIPILAGFGNYAVPLRIGAPDMAFPRINALSFWLLPLGGLLMASGFLTSSGAAASGWTAGSGSVTSARASCLACWTIPRMSPPASSAGPAASV